MYTTFSRFFFIFVFDCTSLYIIYIYIQLIQLELVYTSLPSYPPINTILGFRSLIASSSIYKACILLDLNHENHTCELLRQRCQIF